VSINEAVEVGSLGELAKDVYCVNKNTIVLYFLVLYFQCTEAQSRYGG
jgi:hypothetical protein